MCFLVVRAGLVSGTFGGVWMAVAPVRIVVSAPSIFSVAPSNAVCDVHVVQENRKHLGQVLVSLLISSDKGFRCWKAPDGDILSPIAPQLIG